MSRIKATLAGLTIALMASAPASAAIDWDRQANIKDAAERLVKLHRRQGSVGVLKFLDACYRTHMLASDFNAGLEGCLAQDYMHSNALAQVYARVPPEVRARQKNPSPADIAKGLGERFVAAFSQYKLVAADVSALKALIDRYGMPIFIKGAFPKQTRAPRDVAPSSAPSKAGKS